jgi:hypothetical protein
VFDQFGALIGIVAPPLQLADDTQLEINLVIPAINFAHLIEPVSSELCAVLSPSTSGQLQMSTTAGHVRPAFDFPRSGVVERAAQSLCLVRVGTSWGSGVVITNEGHILTSGHVVQPYLVAPSASDTDGSPLSSELKRGHR